MISKLESAHAVPPQKPQCGTTVCIKRKSICVHFDNMKELQIRAYCSIDKVRSELYTYHLYNGESEVGPDSRHVPLSYFILFQNTLSVIKHKCRFGGGGKRTVVPNPLPQHTLCTLS